ncbi:MAG: hypothetical protein ACOYON_06880 [Fimbriimonas sp.]
MNREKLGVLKEGTVGCVLFGGAGLFVVSAFCLWLFSVAGVYRGTYTREAVTNKITDAGTLNLVPITLAIFTLSCFMIIGALGYGIWTSKADRHGPRSSDPDAKVIARYAYDRNQFLLTDLYQIESADRPRFYVRLDHGRDGMIEYECSEEVYHSAGEGMRGVAEYQGKWLGSFSPHIGNPSTDDPYPERESY